MRITFFIIIFLFISCTGNINKIDNEELKLSEKLASDLIQLSIKCVDKKCFAFWSIRILTRTFRIFEILTLSLS